MALGCAMEVQTMAETYLVFGPPGTGKTERLSRYVAEAANRYDVRQILVCSYTRAAAEVIAGRVDLPRSNVGTLHSFCYRALGSPQLTVQKESEFNKDFPRWRLSQGKADVDNPYGDDREEITLGDTLLEKLDVLRARMVREELWPIHVRAFARDWRTWKESNNLMDFTDLLEIAWRDCNHAPGNPAVGFVDEAQDCSRLQMALIEKWSRPMTTMILSGDDDQVLYSWCGASADAMLNLAIAEDHKRFLTQSYRVPAAVHDLASRWVRAIKRRQPKHYLPRREVLSTENGELCLGAVVPGELRHVNGTFKYPEPVLHDARQYLDQGKTVMFLASCSYMLEPLKQVLRKESLPFHNPYRRKRIDWNPLTPGSKKKVHPIDRVLAFLRPNKSTWGTEASFWSRHQLHLWMECLSSQGTLKPGAKTAFEDWKDDHTQAELTDVLHWLEPEAMQGFWPFIDQMYENDDPSPALHWWLSRCLTDRKNKLAYPAQVAMRHGGAALIRKPQIILGTIHSVKGGEAEIVYLFPDLSQSGMREWLGSEEGKDNVRRMFYVGMTRARETLVLCQPSSMANVPLCA